MAQTGRMATRRLICLALASYGLALCATAAAAQSDFSDFWGAWGQQTSDRNPNEWRTNCAEQRSLLVLMPDRIYTLGGSTIYKDFAECRVLNGTAGAALLLHVDCSSPEENAESVMLEYDVLSEEGVARIQRRGQTGTLYRKCPS